MIIRQQVIVVKLLLGLGQEQTTWRFYNFIMVLKEVTACGSLLVTAECRIRNF